MEITNSKCSGYFDDFIELKYVVDFDIIESCNLNAALQRSLDDHCGLRGHDSAACSCG